MIDDILVKIVYYLKGRILRPAPQRLIVSLYEFHSTQQDLLSTWLYTINTSKKG